MMARLRRSLLLKLILAFWLISILGIGLMALLASRFIQDEFTRFTRENRYQGLTEQLSDYYLKNANFKGADYLLKAAQTQAANGLDREFLVVDPNGNILLSLAEHIPPGLPSPDFVRFGYPIESNKQVIGYLIPMRAPHSQDGSTADNMKRLNLNLWIGLIGTLLVALLFGWFVASTIIRPLRKLCGSYRMMIVVFPRGTAMPRIA